MLKDFERKLRLLFEDALKKGKFHNTFIALKTGDHYLELILHALHNDWDGQSSTLLYYMYDNQFIKTRKEFFSKRKSFDPDITMGLSILYDDYDMIQNNLSIEIDGCDEISNLLFELIDPEEGKPYNLHPDISYRYYGNEIISHECDGGYADFNKDDLKIEIRDDIISKPTKWLDEDWVHRLNEEAQQQVSSFLKQFEKIDYKKDKEIDLSSLLLSLIKAIEIEFRDHYIYNIEGILLSAEKIIDISDSWNNRQKKRLKILINNCKNILLKKDRIKVGGFQWIYNILYHIALCKEIPTGAPSLTYLNEKQVIELKRYETFIKDIERDGESRNRLIHHDFIKSKVIFERLVIHFKSILEALSILKEYNELDK